MNLESSVVLITGGASGIGLAFTERFIRTGSTVIAVGRRADVLDAARERLPGLHTRVCDVALESERVGLLEWVRSEHPRLNVLVNNAGIQRRIDLREGEPWDRSREELVINLEAPIHLATLFLPHLLEQRDPAIVNVTSGLSFVPLANVPIYCATKAALHSFTLSLRHQLASTPVEVIEVIPPAVDTDLGGPGLHTFGVNVNEFADAIFDGFARGESEIAFGTAAQASRASRDDLDRIVARMNAH